MNKENITITKQDFVERIAHMITSSRIPHDLFEEYFKDTQIGYFNYYEIVELLGGKYE